MNQALNPYRPPTAAVELAPDTEDTRPLAGKGRRFTTLLLDYVGFMILSSIVSAVLLVLFQHSAAFLFRGVWGWIYGSVVICVYYMFFEGLWGRTPAKMILGTKVTDLKGQPPTFGAIAKRTLARLVPFEAFSFFGQTGFHDKASKTQVVRTR